MNEHFEVKKLLKDYWMICLFISFVKTLKVFAIQTSLLGEFVF